MTSQKKQIIEWVVESTKAEVETPEFYYPYTVRLSNLSQSIFLILGLILPLGLKTKKVGG